MNPTSAARLAKQPAAALGTGVPTDKVQPGAGKATGLKHRMNRHRQGRLPTALAHDSLLDPAPQSGRKPTRGRQKMPGVHRQR